MFSTNGSCFNKISWFRWILTLFTIHTAHLCSATLLDLMTIESTKKAAGIPSARAGKMTKIKEGLKLYSSFVIVLYSSDILLKAGVCSKKKGNMALN